MKIMICIIKQNSLLIFHEWRESTADYHLSHGFLIFDVEYLDNEGAAIKFLFIFHLFFLSFVIYEKTRNFA